MNQGKALQVVEKDTAEANTERFDLSNYGAGIYLIRVLFISFTLLADILLSPGSEHSYTFWFSFV